MINRMGLQSRKELTLQIRERYDKTAWKEKTKILDGFIRRPSKTGWSSSKSRAFFTKFAETL